MFSWLTRRRPRRDSMEPPPQRFVMMGREYRLSSLGGHRWQRDAHVNGPLTFTYLPVEPLPVEGEEDAAVAPETAERTGLAALLRAEADGILRTAERLCEGGSAQFTSPEGAVEEIPIRSVVLGMKDRAAALLRASELLRGGT